MKTNSQIAQRNKTIVWKFWTALEQADPGRVEDIARLSLSEDIAWFGHDPVTPLHGVAAFVSGFWQPLCQSFPDLKRQSHIFLGGNSNGRLDGDASRDGKYWVSGTGYFNATFQKDYLGIPATGKPVSIRWGEFCRMAGSKIVEIYFLLDLVDLMRQAGIQVLPPSRGVDGLYPPPRTNDGILIAAQDEQVSVYTLAHIRRFIFDGLNRYDQSALASMGIADYFGPDVRWYGPGGIGACVGLKEFEDFHQKPWLKAFPDRQVQDLTALIAEGCYSAAPGWAGVKATHLGQYLDCPATGKRIAINGLDWWKRDGEGYIENWVFVDMIHLFRQLGIDLIERLRQQVEKRQRETSNAH